MTNSYRVLCRVAMRHDYFADGQLRGLAARPTAATTERLRRAGLLLRPLPDGFMVVYADATGGPPPAGLQAAFPLVFYLQPPGPEFMFYTDLPAPAPGRVYHLAPTGPAEAPRLHPGPVLAAADQLPLRPLAFQQALPPGATTATLRHHPDGPLMWEQTDLPPIEPLAVSLRAEGSGAYALQLGEAAPDVFFAADFAPAARPWAVLELGPAVLATPGATYTLSLAVRRTYWHYHLLSHRPLSGGLAIEAGPAGGAFEQQPEPEWPGVAASFRATAARPLAERYPGAAYQLVLPEAGRPPRVVCAALPWASPKGLRLKNNFAEVLSVTDIFVHL